MPIQNLPVWTFEPNWTNSVTETFEWNTRILKSVDGSEQRAALRALPWITYEFTVAVAGTMRQYLDQMLVTHGAGTWYLPLFHEASSIDADAPAGSMVLSGADLSGQQWVQAGAVACIMNGNARQYELVEIASRTSNNVTLVSPSGRRWPAGAMLFPCVPAELTDQPELTHRSGSLATAEIRFRLAAFPGYMAISSDPPIENTMLTTQFRGWPVFDFEPDWVEAPKMRYDRTFVELSNGKGFPIRSDEASRAFTVLERQWVLNGRADHINFIRSIQYLRGRARPVWVPTYNDDLTLTSNVASGTHVIAVTPNGYMPLGGARDDRRFIMIETADGDRMLREVTSLSFIDSDYLLTLTPALTKTFSINQVSRISFLILCRLNHDSVSVEHKTDTMGVSAVKMTFRSSPDSRVAPEAFG